MLYKRPRILQKQFFESNPKSQNTTALFHQDPPVGFAVANSNNYHGKHVFTRTTLTVLKGWPTRTCAMPPQDPATTSFTARSKESSILGVIASCFAVMDMDPIDVVRDEAMGKKENLRDPLCSGPARF